MAIFLVVGGLLLIFLTVQFGFFGISADTFGRLPMRWMIIAAGRTSLGPRASALQTRLECLPIAQPVHAGRFALLAEGVEAHLLKNGHPCEYPFSVRFLLSGEPASQVTHGAQAICATTYVSRGVVSSESCV